MRIYALLFFVSLCCLTANAQKISEGKNLFDPQKEHTHGATIVELPNGDLLTAWFQGNGERWADDVRIMGARLLKGQKDWSKPFVMADVPDFPDINPVLFIDPQEKLWLVWYTVMANQWETSLLKYRTSTDYMQKEGAPNWSWQDVIHVKPGDKTERGIQPTDKFVQSIEKQQKLYTQSLIQQGASPDQLDQWMRFKTDILAKAKGENMIRRGRVYQKDGSHKSQQLGYPHFRRMGWQTKNKAIFIGDRMLLPLYSDGMEMTLFAITDDYGKHWKFSEPLVGIANIQASVAQKKDGTLVTYMRDNGPPPQRHPMSFSKDKGMTWSPVVDSDLPNSGAGSDVVTLKNGHWALAYNDTEDGRHSLAISISTNEGKSWDHIRHIELDNRTQANTGSYPSIIQGKNGSIHLIYSYNHKGKGETIRYFKFDENWVKKGDQNKPTISIGAATRIITPNPLLPISGGVGVPRDVTQKKGDLFVRAMVFEQNGEKVAIVNIDNLGWPAALGNQSRALIKGIKPENILIGATHTHSAPDAYAFPDANGKTRADFKYLNWCVQQVADAVNEAIEKLEPATLKIAEGIAKGKIAYNYYAPQLYDPRCGVIQAINNKEKIIATLVNYAIHPEVIGPKRGILSPDVCGPLYERIEAQTGGVAVFMNGAQGGMVTADNRLAEGKEANDWKECQRIGYLLADEALRIVKDAPIQKNPALVCTSKEVAFPVDAELMQFILKHSPLKNKMTANNEALTQVNLLNIGSAQILTIPGEALPNIGYYLKRNMKGKQNFLFGLTNDAFGYILTKEDFNSFKRYSYITETSLGEETGAILIQNALEMIKNVPSPK